MTQRQYRIWLASMRVCRKVFCCHQLRDRSFHIRGVQLPLCARCTGLVLGFGAVGPVVGLFTQGSIALSLVFVLWMCADGLLQLKGILPSTNPRRLFSGLAAGYGLFSLLCRGISALF